MSEGLKGNALLLGKKKKKRISEVFKCNVATYSGKEPISFKALLNHKPTSDKLAFSITKCINGHLSK